MKRSERRTTHPGRRPFKHRANATERGQRGFTLIELLIVVVIIAVLASIAIPVYLSMQDSSRNASVEADLTNDKTALVSVKTSTGSLPASASDVAIVLSSKDGYTRGTSTGMINYATGPGAPFTFCLSATVVGGDGSTFFITDSSGVQKVSVSAPIVALPLGC